jgi:hypothetical protein
MYDQSLNPNSWRDRNPESVEGYGLADTAYYDLE